MKKLAANLLAAVQWIGIGSSKAFAAGGDYTVFRDSASQVTINESSQLIAGFVIIGEYGDQVTRIA
jgi:hypothetical protein